jgi:hypothetical protein
MIADRVAVQAFGWPSSWRALSSRFAVTIETYESRLVAELLAEDEASVGTDLLRRATLGVALVRMTSLHGGQKYSGREAVFFGSRDLPGEGVSVSGAWLLGGGASGLVPIALVRRDDGEPVTRWDDLARRQAGSSAWVPGRSALGGPTAELASAGQRLRNGLAPLTTPTRRAS